MTVGRGVAALLLVAFALLASPVPADAHVCPVAAIVPVNVRSQITIAVTVEGTPVPDIEFTFPPEVRLNGADPSPGWKITVAGQVVHYRGPPVAVFTCKYFSVEVTALKRGAYQIPFVQRDASGKVVAHSVISSKTKLNPYLEQTVYAGMKPPAPSSGGAPSAGIIAGAALIILGILAAGFVAWRSHRERKQDERDDEIDERLEAFRSRTRDRQPEP